LRLRPHRGAGLVPARDPDFLPHPAPLSLASLPQHGPPVSAGLVRDLLANLQGAARAVLFLPARPGAWRSFPEQLVVLILLDVLLRLAGGFFAAAGEGALHWEGLPRNLLPLTLALLLGWLVAQRSGFTSAPGAVATRVLALQVVFDAAGHLLAAVDPGTDLDVGWMLFAWWATACAVAVTRVAAGRWQARLADGMLSLVVLGLPVWWLPEAPVWSPPGDEDGDEFASGREEVVYGQSQLLHRAAMRLARERPGVEDVYLVAAAGHAGEDVFLNEATLAAELVRTRFDAEGRTLMLSNNPRTLRTLPLASATSLSASLKAVAQVMNPREDVLFLFLTTHGAEDHTLAMEAWPLQFRGITPDMLSRMLDEAGFRWRVVILSACYAGGFIDALSDARTLVITAADAWNQSFGCGSESELTYFGKAFLDEALRSTVMLPQAFDAAREAIRRREQAAGFPPSNPQIFIGGEIGPKLERLAQRLRVSGRARSLPVACDTGAGGPGCAPGHHAAD
jgi:hypothetical protein